MGSTLASSDTTESEGVRRSSVELSIYKINTKDPKKYLNISAIENAPSTNEDSSIMVVTVMFYTKKQTKKGLQYFDFHDVPY